LLDQALLEMPLVGGIRMTMASSRACRSLAATLGSGLPLLRSLDTASIASGDAAVSMRLISARERVRRGVRLSDALAKEAALAPIALRLLSIGERAGDLAVMARRAAEITSRQVRNEIKTMVSLLEPVLVIVLGGLVAMCALALLQAVYAVRPGVAP
jgi:type II secretory pathway component PulF